MAGEFIDTFTAGADVDLEDHTPDVGTGWTREDVSHPARHMHVLSAPGYAYATSYIPAGHYLYLSDPAGSAEHDVSFTLPVVLNPWDTGLPIMLIARALGIDNFYSGGTYAANDPSDKELWKRVGGVDTQLASGDSGVAADIALKLEIRDGSKKLFVDGGELLSSVDNALVAAGSPGVGVGNLWVVGEGANNVWRFDNYNVDEIAPPAGVSTVDLASRVRAGVGRGLGRGF